MTELQDVADVISDGLERIRESLERNLTMLVEDVSAVKMELASLANVLADIRDTEDDKRAEHLAEVAECKRIVDEHRNP